MPETVEQRVDPHVLRNDRHRDRLISQFEKPRGVILAVHIDGFSHLDDRRPEPEAIEEASKLSPAGRKMRLLALAAEDVGE